MNLKAKVFISGYEDLKKYNELFLFYENIWKDTWAELKMDGHHMYDDFLRFSFKIGIYDGSRPVGFHAYQLFDLQKISDRKHTYFQKLPPEVLHHFDRQRVRYVATLEYLSIDPAYRKVASGFPLGSLLASFSTMYLSNICESPVDMIMTITRNDRRTQDMCIGMGGSALLENIPLNNTLVNVMLMEPKNVKMLGTPDIHQIILHLLDEVKIDQQPYRRAA